MSKDAIETIEISKLTNVASVTKLMRGVASLKEAQRIADNFNAALEAVKSDLEERERKLAERKDNIAMLLEQAQELGIDVTELASFAEGEGKKKSKRKPVEPKYEYQEEDGTVRQWTGQGRMPKAMAALIESGEFAGKEDFLIAQ